MTHTLHFRPQNLRALVVALLGLAVLNACQDHRIPPQDVPDAVFYGLTETNQLLRLSAKTPSVAQATVNLTGLQPDERMLGIDFRPATGQLYGVGSSNRLYVINPATGESRAVGGGAFTPTLNGSVVGFDFNPTVDRIRLVTANGQNLRLNPETGTVAATDGNLNPGSPMITAVAYTNNKAGVTTTTLYDIDPNTDRLYRQDPPNNGTLVDVGPLGLSVSSVGGFDIGPDGRGIVSVVFDGKPELDYIDLSTGKLQKLGDLPTTLLGLAIPTEPVAYAVDNGNNLLIFNPMNPAPIAKSISGIQPGELIVGLDFRPANGQLYALGSSNRIYTVNTSSGAAAAVGSGPFTPALSGSDFGFDFNPTVDRIRVVSNLGQNLRLHPETGAVVFTDGTLNPGTPSITGAAYTNNFAGATTTTLFDIDSNVDKLFRQDPPNSGGLVEIGSLGVNVEAANGFDIGGASGTAYALLTVGGGTRVYTINLTTGAATAGAIFPTTPVRAMAVGLGF